MIVRIPVVQTADWIRKAAEAINQLANGNPLPFQRLTSAPADPSVGQSYYDLTDNVVKTWDGSSWQAHW